MSTPAAIIVGLLATAVVAGVSLAVRSLWEQVFGDDPELGRTIGPGNDDPAEDRAMPGPWLILAVLPAWVWILLVVALVVVAAVGLMQAPDSAP